MKVNFKFYLRTLLAAAAVMFMAPGCDDDGPESGTTPIDPGQEVPSYTFSINVSSVLDSRVSVLVTPSELGATFYCGVVTKELFDVFASDAAFLANDVEYLQKEALDREMNFQSYLETVVSVSSTSETVTVPVSGLTKQTEYYAYCYGITLNGEVTSPLAKVAFTSGTPAPVDLKLQSEAKDITTDAVKVAVSALRADGEENAQNGYICEVQLKKTVDDFFADDAALISALEEMYAKADPSEGLMGKVLHGSQDVAVSGLLSGAEYYMILFGYDQTGVTTEVVKSTFTTQEKSGGNQGGDDTRTGYAAWVGDWTITSTSSEVNGKPLSFNVKIAEDVYNKSFKITGWGITGLRTETDFAIAAVYDAATGGFSIDNMQSFGSLGGNQASYDLTLIGYEGGVPITGKYPALTAVPNGAKAGIMTGSELSLQSGATVTVSGAEYFAIDMSAGKFGTFKPADGYTSGDYPIGPYTMKKTADGPVSGGGDDPDPGNKDVSKSDANFTISVTNITSSTATVSIEPKNSSMTYFFDCQPASILAGKTDAEIVALFQEGYGDNFVKLISQGSDYYDYSKLSAGSEYTAVVFGYDVNSSKATTAALSVSFTPNGNGGGGNASEAYKAWIGTWSVTSTSSELTGQPLTFDLTVRQDVANSSYVVDLMTAAWRDDYSKYGSIYPVAQFDAQTGNFELSSFIAFSDSDEDGDYDYYYMVRYRDKKDNKIYVVPQEGLTGLTGVLTSATAGQIMGTTLSAQGTEVGTVTWMDYFYYYPAAEAIYGPKPSNIFANGNSINYPIGPFTLTKKSSQAAPVVKSNVAGLSSVLTRGRFVQSAEKAQKQLAVTSKKAAIRKSLQNVTFAHSFNPLMQLGRVESLLDRTAVASSSNSASLKIYKTVSDIRVRTPRTK